MTFLRIVIPLYLFDLGMIFAQTRSAFVAREKRYPLFRVMPRSARIEPMKARRMAYWWFRFVVSGRFLEKFLKLRRP